MQTSTPENGGYMLAAYLIVAILVLGYAWSLARRARALSTNDN
jgi:CcmD family protein